MKVFEKIICDQITGYFDRENLFTRYNSGFRKGYPTMTSLSFLYICMVNTIYLLSFVETPRKFTIAELSIRKLGSSYYYGTDEDPSLRIESSAIINLRGVSTKRNKYNDFIIKCCK